MNPGISAAAGRCRDAPTEHFSLQKEDTTATTRLVGAQAVVLKSAFLYLEPKRELTTLTQRRLGDTGTHLTLPLPFKGGYPML